MNGRSTAARGPQGTSAAALRWLTLGTALMLLGRAWQYAFWESPWSEMVAWLGPILGLAAVLLAATLVWQRPSTPLLWLAAWLLLWQVGAKVADHGWRWVDGLEHTLAWSTPLLLWAARQSLSRWSLAAKVAVAATFTGHGLFALGWPYPTPPHFVFMTQSILGVTQETALGFLRLAGSLDLVVSVAMFLPQTSRLALAYAVFWGSLTALARPLAYVATESLLEDLHRWAMEMLWRLPHALVPGALWLQMRATTIAMATEGCSSPGHEGP